MPCFSKFIARRMLKQEEKKKAKMRKKQTEEVMKNIKKVINKINSEDDAAKLLEQLRELRNQLLEYLLLCEISFCSGYILPLACRTLSHPSVEVRIEVLKIIQVLFHDRRFTQKLPLSFRQVLTAFLFGRMISLDSDQEKNEHSETMRHIMKSSPPGDQLAYLKGGVIFRKQEDQGDAPEPLSDQYQILETMKQFAKKKGQEFQDLLDDPQMMMDLCPPEAGISQDRSVSSIESIEEPHEEARKSLALISEMKEALNRARQSIKSSKAIIIARESIKSLTGRQIDQNVQPAEDEAKGGIEEIPEKTEEIQKSEKKLRFSLQEAQTHSPDMDHKGRGDEIYRAQSTRRVERRQRRMQCGSAVWHVISSYSSATPPEPKVPL